MIIKIVESDNTSHEAIGSFISLMDTTVHDIKKVLEHIDEDPDYARLVLTRLYSYVRKRNLELQTGLGFNPLNETRYSQFKRESSVRTPSETVHKAIKEMYKKVKELRRVIEFAGRIKTELNQGGDYKKRTAEALQKLSMELKEISSTLRKEWKTPKTVIKK